MNEVNNNADFDELLEYRRLIYQIEDLKKELANSQYDLYNNRISNILLENASRNHAERISSKKNKTVYKRMTKSHVYDELSVVCEKLIGVTITHNGLPQEISNSVFYLDELFPAPTNEGSTVAIFAKINNTSELQLIEKIVSEFPYIFDLYVLCEESIDDDSYFSCSRMKKFIIRCPYNYSDSEMDSCLFSEEFLQHDQLVIIKQYSESIYSNLDYRRCASLLHNLLYIEGIISDEISWYYLGRMKDLKGFQDALAYNNDLEPYMLSKESVAKIDKKKLVIINNQRVMDNKKEVAMENKEYLIPENIDDIKSELVRCMKKIDELEEQQKELKESVQKKKDEIELRNTEIVRKMEKQMSVLKRENTGLKVANALIKESLSWKLTKPLRDIGAIFVK
ncbi:coiled-coil domain-containing protein [Butyrivibrio sp. JL13D10]|uniref:coiled-coil domain-containing protein n=1 Tax=Butyrivibrio sp. JL13D10 TaxID=3236815 RepID=UPI0038B4E5F9